MSRVLQKIDTVLSLALLRPATCFEEMLTHVKEVFMKNENALLSKD